VPHHHFQAAWAFLVCFTLCIVLTSLVYLRGWFQLRSISFSPVPVWRAASFLGGLLLIWIAMASPVAALDHELLTVHMIQHLLLMTFAAPLILLGEPAMLLLDGLPRRFVRAVIDPLFGSPLIQQAGKALTRPVFCWLAAVAALVVWHIPAAFNLGMQSEAWHVVEHVSFFGTGLLFWSPVIQPWPSVSNSASWSMVLYLFLAMLPCDILSGFLVFSERVAYVVYLATPGQQSRLSVLADQECAGALMWTCVTIVYLVAGTILSTRLLSPKRNLQSLEVR